MPEALEVWTDFNVAMVGATAALAGLLIVAVSVNLKSIITSVALTARVAAALSMLVVALAASASGMPALYSRPRERGRIGGRNEARVTACTRPSHCRGRISAAV